MKQERKNRVYAWYASIGLHAVLTLVLVMALAWQPPDPPIPTYGIDLGFVTDLPDQQVEDPSPAAAGTEEVSDAAKEETASTAHGASHGTPPPTEVNEASEEATPQAESEEDASDSPAAKTHSPDVVEQPHTNEPSPAHDVAEKKQQERQENAPKAQEGVEEPAPSEPAIDQRALFKKDKTNGAGTTGKNSSLELVGWNWDAKPKPNDTSNATGIVVFQITIDSEGEIIGIKTLKKTVSPAVEQVYRNAVMALTFSKKSDYQSAAPTSTGKVTFTIQSK